jgi:hypothetical protein
MKVVEIAADGKVCLEKGWKEEEKRLEELRAKIHAFM